MDAYVMFDRFVGGNEVTDETPSLHWNRILEKKLSQRSILWGVPIRSHSGRTCFARDLTKALIHT